MLHFSNYVDQQVRNVAKLDSCSLIEKHVLLIIGTTPISEILYVFLYCSLFIIIYYFNCYYFCVAMGYGLGTGTT